MSVMVVEDNDMIREIAVEELGEAGFAVADARTADLAVPMLDRLDPPLSLLVTDIHMPGRLDGISLAQHVRARFPGVPIVFTTGHPGALQAFGTLTNENILVRKPYNPADLVKTVRCLVG